MGPRKPPALKDLGVYFVEVDESCSNGVPDETLQLLRHCIMDKIFAENPDHIAICRSDMISSVEFVQASWDALRKVESTFHETKLAKEGKEGNCISALSDICEVLISQAEEDSYEARKIIFFGHLKAQEIDEKAASRLAKTLQANSITISLILTDEEFMDDQQLKNLKVLNSIFSEKGYDEWIFVTSHKKAKRQILNTLSNRSKKPTAWNVSMEIGPDISINVGGYVCTRKNKKEMTRALLKSAPPEPATPVSAESNGSPKAPTAAQKTVVMEVAKKVTEKEVSWKEKDGSVVQEDDVGKGFVYGDKIVPFNELENAGVYETGEKCLKLLVFCPAANIKPEYHMGDGTTLFFPKKNDTASEMKFDALLKAMHTHDRVAIARKIYRKNTRVNLCVMAPDMERMCLVLSEICFADDVSVPHFPVLIKESHSEDEGITRQEELIDELITVMSIDEFDPLDGPIDPALSIVRQTVAKRILDQESEAKKPLELVHGIDLFFDEMVLKDDLLANLKEAFPLKVNKEEGERPAGANIFRKRDRAEDQTVGPEKKLKLEEGESNGNADKESGVGTLETNDVDMDDLLDEL